MNRPLPTPTNLQAKKLLRRLCNRIGLAPLHVCRTAKHDCVLCGQAIAWGEEYRDGGYAARAHVECVAEMSRRLP